MKAVVEILLWWIALSGVYVVTLSSPSTPELAAGAAVALLGAWAARAARKAMRGAWRTRVGWVRWLISVPWPALRESCVAVATVFRDPDAGHVETLALPAEPGSALAARQAVATIVIGSTPGTMVIAAPAGAPGLVVHRLFAGPAPVLDLVRR